MHDPMTQICTFPSYDTRCWMEKRKWIPRWLARFELFTLWHNDPCNKRGCRDDSCGWFKRASHGDPVALEKIIKEFTHDWDRVFRPSKADHDPDDGPFVGKEYHCGLFKPSGHPNLSVQGIVLNLFFIAINQYFAVDGSTNWKKSRRWMQKNLFDILMFAENPTDSLFDGITRKFEDGCDEPQTAYRREERIRSMASTIYGWILRREQKWWQHPRWHVHHWSVQIHCWQLFHRWAFVRCSKCRGRFRWRESVIGSWDGDSIWHDRCDDSHARILKANEKN